MLFFFILFLLGLVYIGFLKKINELIFNDIFLILIRINCFKVRKIIVKKIIR